MTTPQARLPECAVDGCARPVFVMWAGLCQAHYLRLWATGDVGGPLIARRSARRWKSGSVTYDGAQMRLRRTRGPATANLCARCGEPAHRWKLIDPDRASVAASGPRAGLRYSADPRDYEAWCRKCLISNALQTCEEGQLQLFDL